MKVTVTQDWKKIIFTWNDACDECTYKNLGFEENEINEIIRAQAHEGKNVDGFVVDIEM